MQGRRRSGRECVEKLEARCLLASAPLHVVGNHLVNDSGATVRLAGVNAPSLAWNNTGDNLLPSIAAAYDLWKSNCVRLPLSQDRWFGYAGQSDGGASYRALVDTAIQLASSRNAYLVLDLHWSDQGLWGQNLNQYRMPDDNSTVFWNDVATRYKNNPAVLFDLYNEPHDIDWNTWRNGGMVPDSITYHSPGMQGLLSTVRATGAKNICIAGGLDWAYDLSGILQGYALSDTSGNLMYSSHVYPFKSNWDSSFGNEAATFPVFVGEVGHWAPSDSGHQNDPSYQTWDPQILDYLDSKGISWTGWSFHNGASPMMISDWNYTPTYYWGQYAKDRLASYVATPSLGIFTASTNIGSGTYGAGSQVSASYNLTGSGSDIWNSFDGLQYLNTSVTGNQTLITRISPLAKSEYSDPNAKGGIMFRDSSATGARNVSVFELRDGQVYMSWRDTANQSTGWSGAAGQATSSPQWLKLVRSGTTFAGYYAITTGVPSASDWILIATHTTTLSSTYLAGLAVCSHTSATTTSATFSSLLLSSSTAAPTIAARYLNDNTAQRSMVTSATYTFSTPVLLDPTAFSLTRRSDGSTIALNIANPSGDSRTYILTFANTGVANDSLADGIYDLTLSAAAVHDARNQNLTGDNQTYTFHRLYGDYDGNKVVNGADYFQFNKAFAASSGDAAFRSFFDYEGNGTINGADYFQFNRRFGVIYSY